MSPCAKSLLLYQVRDDSLDILSRKLDKCFEGLTQAARVAHRQMLISAKARKQLCNLDVAYNVMRHINQVKSGVLVAELEATRRPEPGTVPVSSSEGVSAVPFRIGSGKGKGSKRVAPPPAYDSDNSSVPEQAHPAISGISPDEFCCVITADRATSTSDLDMADKAESSTRAKARAMEALHKVLSFDSTKLQTASSDWSDRSGGHNIHVDAPHSMESLCSQTTLSFPVDAVMVQCPPPKVCATSCTQTEMASYGPPPSYRAPILKAGSIEDDDESFGWLRRLKLAAKYAPLAHEAGLLKCLRLQSSDPDVIRSAFVELVRKHPECRRYAWRVRDLMVAIVDPNS
jgi:hypothetical protein